MIVRMKFGNRLPCPSRLRGKARPIGIIELEELIRFAIGQHLLNLHEITVERIFEGNTLPADDGDGPCHGV